MENRGKTNELSTTSISKTALLERYGDHLEGSDFNDEQAREFLGALWQIMVAFVDVGFSVKAGEKLNQNSDIGFDDVLNYLCLEDTAPETVASSNNVKKKEPR
ncbi:hypothetical protein TQ29_14100 [Actibacterium sp. EMB200-NS6]|uniref:Uncharacterized protein n=2 Tax=Actibacterium naphthalenivorans TaxID=1614693 RepID=A0A840CNH9_9RHOB|nr:hypothetical protein [Actibacterium sp. EMB200-NS6]ALG91111.1 hypothetical protein TQ29_14100 [Actibacterium sp. EMB200-NS6]MBB4023517.1 hypothetical protein [Actibacterium naphthalenivorans]